MTDRSLEALLIRTARDIEYPETPALHALVAEAISVPEPLRAPALVRRPAFGLALLVVAIALVAALAIAPSRDAIARLFGVEGSRIEFLPTPLPGETATPFPTTAPMRGEAIEPHELPARAGFEAMLPDVPDARLNSVLVFYGGQAVAVHRYPEFDLWQTRLDMKADTGFGKGVPGDGYIEEVEVGGFDGVWVSGAEHYVYYFDACGQAYRDSQRTVDRNTLIWRTDAFFYRIETDLQLADALRIAVTLP
jgi:hypothetical protein